MRKAIALILIFFLSNIFILGDSVTWFDIDHISGLPKEFWFQTTRQHIDLYYSLHSKVKNNANAQSELIKPVLVFGVFSQKVLIDDLNNKKLSRDKKMIALNAMRSFFTKDKRFCENQFTQALINLLDSKDSELSNSAKSLLINISGISEDWEQSQWFKWWTENKKEIPIKDCSRLWSEK